MAQLDTQILPLLPLTTGVVLPGMVITLTVESDDARRAITAADATRGEILLVPKVGQRFAQVGTVAKVEDVGRLQNGMEALVIRGMHRAVISRGVPGTGDAVWVEVDPRPDEIASPRANELAREYRATLESIVEARGVPQVAEFLRGISDPGQIADTAGYSPDLSFEQKVDVLETLDVERRLERVLEWAKDVLAELDLKDKIRSDVREGLEKNQREFILRQQMDAIRKELGEDSEENVVEEYRRKIAEANMPDGAQKEAERELGRLERTSEQSPEYGWIRTYLDWMTEIPWGVRTEDTPDSGDARRILDEDHKGLDDVKDRIVEYLAVRKLRDERGLGPASGRGSGAILTLVGPPGVGKTSLGESVARALGRKFVRISLGGIHDEAEIRGHRRTYVGGLAEGEVEITDDAIRQIVVDHTREAGVRNLERELGKVLRKVATKLASGEATAPIHVGSEQIREYLGRPRFFFEAGERTSVPGVATGLAVTGTGGDVLFIEATRLEGAEGPDGLVLTGQLGNVMKESGQIALSYVRSHAGELGIAPDRLGGRFHVHVPAGAVPKDGPSAGVTMVTAIASLLSGRAVKSTVGMTGEVTLQGRVLPIGGVKQKVLAAHRAGLREVILPKRNEGDLEDVPESIRPEMTFHIAETIDDVLTHALEQDQASSDREVG